MRPRRFESVRKKFSSVKTELIVIQTVVRIRNSTTRKSFLVTSQVSWLVLQEIGPIVRGDADEAEHNGLLDVGLGHDGHWVAVRVTRLLLTRWSNRK